MGKSHVDQQQAEQQGCRAMANTDPGAGVRAGSARGMAGPELALARQSSGQQTGADSRAGAEQA